MPGMDGYEITVEIKKLERGKNVPIVMVTAIFREDPQILKGYAVGAIDYVAKPFDPDILKAKVGVYANLYLKSRQNASLQEAERLLRDEGNAQIILETMPIGVIVFDRSGAIQATESRSSADWAVKTTAPRKSQRLQRLVAEYRSADPTITSGPSRVLSIRARRPCVKLSRSNV